MSREPMPTAYDPTKIEADWSERWEKARLFVADAASPKPKYSIAVPPPNVTGELHMGHATNGPVQPDSAHNRRTTGPAQRWLAGPDNTALATQNLSPHAPTDACTSKRTTAQTRPV